MHVHVFPYSYSYSLTINAHTYLFRRVMFDRSAQFPAMEDQLHQEFHELRRKGVKVKG